MPADEVSQVLGTIGMYAEICVIAEAFVVGIVLDIFGRKAPLVVGQLVVGVAIAAVPLFKTVYPSFFILRVAISLGVSISLNVPLLPDYIHKDSIGLANSYIELIICMAQICGSAGLLTISASI